MFKISEPNQNKEVFIQVDNLGSLTKKGVRNAYFLLSKDIVAGARKLIKDPPKTGRIYFLRKKRGGRIFRHQASARGESPANFTGTLQKRVNKKIRGSTLLEVGDSAVYAAFLELDPLNRPFLIKSIKNNQRNAEQHFGNEIQKALV